MSQRQLLLEGPPPACDVRIRFCGRRWIVTATYEGNSVSGSSGANLALAFWDLKLRLRELDQ